MTEEMLLKKLKEIEDISVRKEAKDIYKSVFEQISQYQKEALLELEKIVNQSLCPKKMDYGIDMFVVSIKDSDMWQSICEVVDCTCNYAWEWEEQQIKRIYLAADKDVLIRLMETKRDFSAVIRTNYDTYKCEVTLREGGNGSTFVKWINDMLISNSVDIPKVSDAYAKRFFDVVYSVQKDRLRKDESIEAIEIDWEELTPYVKEDVALLCNAKKRNVKEQIFPFFERDEIRYRHEICLLREEYGYLIDVSELKDYEIQRMGEKCWIKTTQKAYKEWQVYEIVPREYWEKYGKAEIVLSNRVRESSLTNMQRKRKYTIAEIYRAVLAYGVSKYFDKIELNEYEIIFWVINNRYIVQDLVDFIVEDMKELYPGIEFRGKILNGFEESI